MKLVRYGSKQGPQLGAVKGDGIVDLGELKSSLPTMLSVIAGGTAALDRVNDVLARATPRIALAGAPLLAPVERPGKYLAIGMNYRKHAEEAAKLGIAIPTQQLWFNKQTSCIAGPFDPIEPGVTDKLDYEVELAYVIGKPARYAAEADASQHVFGYVVANDVSARDWQMHSPTFTLGKSFDTHGPIGPCLVTADEIPDPHTLGVRCFVNGEKRQDSNTSDLIYNIWQQIAYLSTALTLETGDLFATGTPSGVGIALTPPQFLNEGDVVRCEVDGIGAIENRVGAKRR